MSEAPTLPGGLELCGYHPQPGEAEPAGNMAVWCTSTPPGDAFPRNLKVRVFCMV